MVAVNLRTLGLPEWRFYLGYSPTLEEIGELRRSRNRHMDFDILGGPFAASMDVPTNLKVSREIATGKTCLICKRDGESKWSGPIVTTDETLPGTTVNVSAVGWFELLNHRIIREDQITLPNPPLQYILTDRGKMAFDLLDLANAQLHTLITKGFRGDMHPDTFLDKNFERDTGIGQEISNLATIEGGFDYEVNAGTRQLNLWSSRGEDRRDVLYAYGKFPFNLSTANRKENAGTMANRVTARGKYASRMAEDTIAQAIYGLYEEVASLSDVTDADSVLGYAGQEIIFRSTPRVTYTITPKPTQAKGVRIFDDFDLGDTIYSSIHGGRMALDDQAMRVLGFGIDVRDDGAEHVSSLKTEES